MLTGCVSEAEIRMKYLDSLKENGKIASFTATPERVHIEMQEGIKNESR